MAKIASERKEWAGIPLPIDGQTLVVEPTYPFADAVLTLNGVTKRAADEPVEDVYEGARLRNCFWSWSRRADIYVWEHDGRILWGLRARGKHIDEEIETLGASQAWSLETECRAMETLRGLIRHHQFRQYLLTGSFLESSARSGVKYLFRRLRPTIAMSARGEQMKILCALCLHPIAYYSGSWAGAMCPTDDVLAALMLMRGDEHMLWKRANQHAPWRPEAGL